LVKDLIESGIERVEGFLAS